MPEHEHRWFPYWTDRNTFTIEWFCQGCTSWKTRAPEMELREALDEIWGLLPFDEVEQISQATYEIAVNNHRLIWGEPTLPEGEVDRPSRR